MRRCSSSAAVRLFEGHFIEFCPLEGQLKRGHFNWSTGRASLKAPHHIFSTKKASLRAFNAFYLQPRGHFSKRALGARWSHPSIYTVKCCSTQAHGQHVLCPHCDSSSQCRPSSAEQNSTDTPNTYIELQMISRRSSTECRNHFNKV